MRVFMMASYLHIGYRLRRGAFCGVLSKRTYCIFTQGFPKFEENYGKFRTVNPMAVIRIELSTSYLHVLIAEPLGPTSFCEFRNGVDDF